MERSFEDRVRDLAYFKWEKAGRPLSDGVKFWLEAENELDLVVLTCGDKKCAVPGRKVAAKKTFKRK